MITLLLAALALQVSSDTLVRRAPAEVGMCAERLARIDEVLATGVRAGGFPGAAVVIARRGAIVWETGIGSLSWSAGAAPIDPRSSLFDLASITKVMATGLAIMLLHDDGRLSLDDPVSRHLPEFKGEGRDNVTIRQLLIHRSGLPAAPPPAGRLTTPPQRRRQVLATPLRSRPGERTIYSDVGPMVLAFVVEAVAREPIDRFLQRRVYGPAGMRRTFFRPPAEAVATLVPTLAGVPQPFGRDAVHDPNARLLGGVAGHAGLFAAAVDVAAFGQLMLNGGSYAGRRLMSDSTVALFTRPTAGMRALAWSICHGGGSCGRYLSGSAFGHTGFTGTSLWVDPERELVVVVLTNWVHRPPVEGADEWAVIADVRADVAEIAALAVLNEDGSAPPMPDRLRVERKIGWYPYTTGRRGGEGPAAAAGGHQARHRSNAQRR